MFILKEIKTYLYIIASVLLFVGVIIGVSSSGIATAGITDELGYNKGVVEYIEIDMSVDVELLVPLS